MIGAWFRYAAAIDRPAWAAYRRPLRIYHGGVSSRAEIVASGYVVRGAHLTSRVETADVLGPREESAVSLFSCVPVASSFTLSFESVDASEYPAPIFSGAVALVIYDNYYDDRGYTRRRLTAPIAVAMSASSGGLSRTSFYTFALERGRVDAKKRTVYLLVEEICPRSSEPSAAPRPKKENR